MGRLHNDSDFGISGKQHDGEYLEIEMSSLPAKTSIATVTLNVNGAH